MKRRNITAVAIIVGSLSLVVSISLAAQDNKATVKALNGVAFSDFKGYENWESVAPSQTDEGIKVILANAVMMKAYREGIPGNGKPFPDGSVTVKIEWTKKKNLSSPYNVLVPENLKSVSFILKDSKRFPDTSGWGYAQFLHDAASDTFKPYGADANFGKTVCYQCHTRVKSTDYIFTAYAKR